MGKTRFAWKTKGQEEGREVLTCNEYGATAFGIRSEPVKRKRHTKTAHKRRIVAVCHKCKKIKRIAYGGAPGRRKSLKAQSKAK